MSNSDLDTLLRETDSPPMSIDAERVLTRGRQRRNLRLGGTVAGAAAGGLALVTAVTLIGGPSSEPTFTPGGSTQGATMAQPSPTSSDSAPYDFFDQHIPGLAAGEVRMNVSGERIYRVTEDADGALKVALMLNGQAQALSLVGTAPGGVRQFSNGTNRISVAPIPRTSVGVEFRYERAIGDNSQSGGVLLASGRSVGVQELPNATSGAVRAALSFGADSTARLSTGESVSVVKVQGAGALPYYYLSPEAGQFGSYGEAGYGSIPLSLGQDLIREEAAPGSADEGKYKTMQVLLVPAGATQVKAQLASGAALWSSPEVMHFPGTDCDLVVVTGTTERSASTEVRFITGITWTDKNGRSQQLASKVR